MSSNRDKRLGLSYQFPGVDPKNVPAFAKIARLIGVVLVVVFISWGLLYEWSYSRSPFEEILKEFGIPGNYREIWALVLAGALGVVGWFYRFSLGAFFTFIVFWLLSVIGKIFKSI